MPKSITLAAAVLATLALAACGSDGSSTPAASVAPQSLTGTSWTLTSFPANGTGAATTVPAAVKVTANFGAVDLSGTGGCNTYSTAYKTDGSTIAIAPIRSTRIACDGLRGAVETIYFELLDTATSFAVTGTTLTLTAPGEAKLVFTKAVAVPLMGTKWTATGINNGKQGVEPPVTGSTVTALFDKDGKVSGNATCNTYSGSYTTQAAKLSFGELASTQRACAEKGFNEQETVYLAALGDVTTYVITDGVLELRAKDGSLQASYQPAKK